MVVTYSEQVIFTVFNSMYFPEIIVSKSCTPTGLSYPCKLDNSFAIEVGCMIYSIF